jgi:signal transduction histidine kinase
VAAADDRPRETATRLVTSQPAVIAAAFLLAVLAVAQTWAQTAGKVPGITITGYPQGAGTVVAAVLVSLAATVPLGLLWGYPAAAAWAVSIANLLSFGGFRLVTVAGLIAQLGVLYRLGRTGSQVLAAGLVVPFLVVALVPLSGIGLATKVMVVLAASLGPMAAWAGSARLARSQAIELSTEHQEIAGSLLEHTARGERARISRELHDVVAHHISMISVQAETARLTTPGLPAAGAQRLSAIGDTARSALTEMRRLLGVLRADTTDVVARQPQPGLAQLTELLDLAREAAGSGTRLIVSGRLAQLDPGVELAAYRIVQEALSNARQHAPGAAVDVELGYADTWLYVRIRDNGPGPGAQAAAGHGLLGMRERAAAVGGQLRTGLATGGGFVVEAVLPARAEVT